MHDRFNKASLPILLTLGVAAGLYVQTAVADTDESLATPNAPVSGTEASAARMSGQKVYTEVCIACHLPPGFGGAPGLGDAAAWAPRIAKGKETLVDHALNGFSTQTGLMPKKGGRLDLTDEEVVGAVEYMLEQVAR
ncbi:MAG: c-type cytochrome [Gammaproteobacteria bacterium]